MSHKRESVSEFQLALLSSIGALGPFFLIESIAFCALDFDV
jgi:hypothetical protein